MSEILINSIRSGLIDNSYRGFIKFLNREGQIQTIGEDPKTLFFLRSLAKPIQASVLIDTGAFNHFNLSSLDLAIICASHAGEEVHVKQVASVLNKAELDESYLQCGEHAPLYDLNKKGTQLTNNCSGKHAGFLLTTKHMNWPLENYLDLNHPLQKKILLAHQKLCDFDCAPFLTNDGCSSPIWAMPLDNIIEGLKNVFFKYEQIKNAFLKHPYLIGGKNRLDTQIMEASPSLIAKVGASGFVIIINIDTEEILLIKSEDGDNTHRALITQEALKQLGWADLNIQDTQIKTLKGLKVGEFKANFKLYQ